MHGKSKSEILTRIIKWGEENRPIQTMILEGSRAILQNPDPAADFDLGIFTNKPVSLHSENEWYRNFYQVWVAVHESFLFENETIQTRLVIYADGIKVDFAIYPAHLFEQFMLKKPWAEVLLDKKDQWNTESAGTFQGIQPEKPERADFDRLVQEFWFEAYHVVKYLSRNELWQMKFRDWSTKELLLTMIEWYSQSLTGWQANTWFRGKNIEKWAPVWINEELHSCFARYDARDSLKAFKSTLNLFKNLSGKTAVALGFSSEHFVPMELKNYILDRCGELQ